MSVVELLGRVGVSVEDTEKAASSHPIGAWEDELDVIRQGLVAESAKNRSTVWVPLDPLKPSFSYL